MKSYRKELHYNTKTRRAYVNIIASTDCDGFHVGNAQHYMMLDL